MLDNAVWWEQITVRIGLNNYQSWPYVDDATVLIALAYSCVGRVKDGNGPCSSLIDSSLYYLASSFLLQIFRTAQNQLGRFPPSTMATLCYRTMRNIKLNLPNSLTGAFIAFMIVCCLFHSWNGEAYTLPIVVANTIELLKVSSSWRPTKGSYSILYTFEARLVS